MDVLEIDVDLIKAVDGDGAVKADAAENKVAVNVRAVKDFIVIAIFVIRWRFQCNIEVVLLYRCIAMECLANLWHLLGMYLRFCSWS